MKNIPTLNPIPSPSIVYSDLRKASEWAFTLKKKKYVNIIKQF